MTFEHREPSVPVRGGLFVGLLLATAVASCRAPLVREAGREAIPVAAYAPGSEEVVVEAADGVHLRGVFTPANPETTRHGLVVHFLPTGASVTTGLAGGFGGVKECPGLFAQEGWDSLMIDYRGVGASEGERGTKHFASDARAVGAEAETRRGEDGLLVLRGVSLGSLAVAALLGDEVAVDAVVLHAPVRSSTVVDLGARDRFGAFFGSLAALFLLDPPLPDLLDVLPAVERRQVFLPEEDRFLDSEARVELRMMTADVPGLRRLHYLTGHDHDDVVLRAFGLEITEFSGRHRDRLSEEEARFLRSLPGARD